MLLKLTEKFADVCGYIGLISPHALNLKRTEPAFEGGICAKGKPTLRIKVFGTSVKGE